MQLHGLGIWRWMHVYIKLPLAFERDNSRKSVRRQSWTNVNYIPYIRMALIFIMTGLFKDLSSLRTFSYIRPPNYQHRDSSNRYWTTRHVYTEENTTNNFGPFENKANVYVFSDKTAYFKKQTNKNILKNLFIHTFFHNFLRTVWNFEVFPVSPFAWHSWVNKRLEGVYVGERGSWPLQQLMSSKAFLYMQIT